MRIGSNVVWKWQWESWRRSSLKSSTILFVGGADGQLIEEVDW